MLICDDSQILCSMVLWQGISRTDKERVQLPRTSGSEPRAARTLRLCSISSLKTSKLLKLNQNQIGAERNTMPKRTGHKERFNF